MTRDPRWALSQELEAKQTLLDQAITRSPIVEYRRKRF
jgi:hypothetical protein